MARKDVEAKAISQEATKAILLLEKQFMEIMSSLGMERDDENYESLMAAGEMLTEKLRELEERDILPEVKAKLAEKFHNIHTQAMQRLDESLDSYMEKIKRKEKRSW